MSSAKRIRSKYIYSGQQWPAKHNLSTWVNLSYLEEETRPCDLVVDCAKETSRKQRRTSIVRNTLKPIIPSSPASRTSRPTWTHHSSYTRIAANVRRRITARIRTSFATWFVSLGRPHILVQLQLLGDSFDVVPADGAMNTVHTEPWKSTFCHSARGQGLLMLQVVALLQFILIIGRKQTLFPYSKKGSRNKSVNYRPVSLTSVISKLLETIIMDHMMDFLVKHKLINPSQHGFIKASSCLTNWLCFFRK